MTRTFLNSCAPVFVLIGLVACSAPETPNVRSGPQTQLPYTPGPNSGLAVAGPLTTISPATSNSGEANISSEVTSTTGTASLDFAFNTFKNGCLRFSPDVDALATFAEQQGMTAERFGENSLLATSQTFGATSGSSLQVNVATSHSYECAVTAVTSSKVNKRQTRQSFFDAIGVSQRNGAGTISVNGAAYQVRHVTHRGAEASLTEHVFVLQAK